MHYKTNEVLSNVVGVVMPQPRNCEEQAPTNTECVIQDKLLSDTE